MTTRLHRSLSIGVLALATAILATPAHAVSGLVTAEISHLEFQLIDLDPNDGIIPSIEFVSGLHEVSINAFSANHFDRISEYGSISFDALSGGADASASPGGIASSSYYTSGERSQVIHTHNTSWRGFTLSPSTGLLVSAKGAIHAEHEGAQSGFASLMLMLSLSAPPGLLEGETSQGHDYRIGDGSRAYQLSAYLASGTVEQHGLLGMNTLAVLEYYAPVTPPVPEPATYGMLLVGAAVVGAVARRRKRA